MATPNVKALAKEFEGEKQPSNKDGTDKVNPSTDKGSTSMDAKGETQQSNKDDTDKAIPSTGNESTTVNSERTLTFKETSAGISITWIADKDATSYKVYMQRGNESSDKDTSIPSYVFKNSVYDWSHGEKLRITVKSVGKDKKEMSLLHNVEYVVGGNTVVNTVQVKTNDRSPHNTIDLSWSEPKQKPEAYEVVLYKEQGKNEKNRFQCKETTATFPGLRTYTEYFCTITAKYQDTSLEKPVTSDVVKTLQEPLPQSTGVKAYTHPDNPIRCIVVDWSDVHIDFTVTTFKVYLQFEKDGKPITTKAKNVTGAVNVTAFGDLKSHTKYTAYVEAIGHHKKSKTFFSNEAATDCAVRRPGFDIKEAGKPKIQSCSTTVSHNKLKSNFTWNLAEIGDQKKNFKFIGVVASYKDGGPVRNDLAIRKDSCSAEPIDLQWGNTYLFRVTCLYVDLDSGEKFDLIDDYVLNTDIGKPSMQTVTWEGEQVTAKWTFALGASEHVFKVVNEAKKIVLEEAVQASTRTFKMTSSCAYGRICTFVIEANKEINRKTSDFKEILIGGERAVLGAVAIKCDENPRRQIIVKWKEPKRKPKFYKLELYELHQIQTGSEISIASKFPAIEQIECKHRFLKLKSKTTYSCKVIPMYDDRPAGGSISNPVETEKRTSRANESEADFGLPESITNTLETIGSEVCAILRWTRVELSENYELLHYRIEVVQEGYFWNSDIFKDTVKAENHHVNIPNIKMGDKYAVKFYTVYKDLDIVQQQEKRKEYTFSTKPKQTRISSCKWKNKFVYLTWTPVHGAAKYQLILKDDFLKESLAANYTSKVSMTDDGCSARVPMSEDLRIGKICMAKVMAYVKSGLKSETDWNTFLIGGDLVPRNVKATTNTDDPKRSAIISFDAPTEGPADHYLVQAIPQNGRKKCETFKTSPALFEYLRKGVSYKFEVLAIKGNCKSEGSASNCLTTERGDGHDPMLNFQGKGGEYNFQSSNFAGSTTNVNLVKGEDFGKVRNAGTDITNDGDQDQVSLRWIIPSFDNRAADYKVVRYDVTIRQKDGQNTEEFNIKFEKNRNQYSTEKYPLKLDGKYEIEITTVYEDIDEDAVSPLLSSAYKLTVSTRPGNPKVTTNDWKGNEMIIIWNAVKGAHRYYLEIFTEDSQQPLTYHTKFKTEWTQKLDDKFGFGVSYYAVVTAYSIEGKSNSYRTEKQTIGGDYVPRNVIASSKDVKITEPNTQVFLMWDAPTKTPLSYEVEAMPNADVPKTAIDDTSCLLSGLKAGTFYQFKVAAIHKAEEGTQKSGGCLSNTIQTDPKPTQVKNVQCFLGETPSTGHKITWDKVNPEKQDESTTYRVTIVKCTVQKSEGYKQEIIVSTEEAIICGLVPGSSYEVAVAGGNSEGYGRESEKVKFTTEFGVPKDVQLVPHYKSPSTSLVLNYRDADGRPDKYEAVLYKIENQIKQEVITGVVVQRGHVYENLAPNTIYYVKICGIYGKNKGKHTKSKEGKTAPSQPTIHEICCAEEDDKSSKELFVGWESATGCTEHQVLIERGKFREEECRILVQNKNELRYTCQLEATEYWVQVCSRNDSTHFGPWSEYASVELTPARLENVVAKLDEKGYNIIVQCDAVDRASTFYYIQPICDGKNHEEPVDCDAEADETIVRHRFLKLLPARTFTFKMWAQNSRGIKGKAAFSNSVSSRPDTVKIKTLERAESDPTTDIQTTWEKQDRCDAYEVRIRSVDENGVVEECLATYAETSCVYRCKRQGNKYAVSVRAVCRSVCGDWVEDRHISLVPAEVELQETGESDVPVNSVEIKWKSLKVTPDGYIIKMYLNENKQPELHTHKVDNKVTTHIFKEKLKPGSLCYCTVAAYNEGGVGKSVKTGLYRIAWLRPSYFSIIPDDNDPLRKVKMSWEKPFGVNCFKLRIENNQTGMINTLELKEQDYVFRSGLPGNSYTVKLYCGCDSRYDLHCEEKSMTMEPEAPTDISAHANRSADSLLVEFKDSCLLRKPYEVVVEPKSNPKEKRSLQTKQKRLLFNNLTPGESYAISITAIIGEIRSRKVYLDGYAQTFPDKVRRPRSIMEKGSILFEWDKLEIKPSKYIVQWRVDNEPITEEHTQATSFMIFFLKPAHCYSARVMAANSSGVGQMSDWENFITDPSPPYGVKVYPDPESPKTSLIVKYQDEKDTLKRYRITAEGPGENPKTVVTHEHFAVLSGLKPGTSYMVKVQTLFCGKESAGAPFSRI